MPDDNAPCTDNASFSSCQIARKVTVMFTPIGLWHQHTHVLSRGFIRAATKHRFGGATERLNGPFFVNHHHGVGHGCKNGFQMSFALFQFVAAPRELVIGGAKPVQGALPLEEEGTDSRAKHNENTQSRGRYGGRCYALICNPLSLFEQDQFVLPKIRNVAFNLGG
jgi:hypothetical protein